MYIIHVQCTYVIYMYICTTIRTYNTDSELTCERERYKCIYKQIKNDYDTASCIRKPVHKFNRASFPYYFIQSIPASNRRHHSRQSSIVVCSANMSWSFLCAVVSTVLSQWAFLLAVVVYFVWRKISPPYEFYTDRGIVYKSTMPLIGNMSRLFISKESIFDMIINDYKEFAGKR